MKSEIVPKYDQVLSNFVSNFQKDTLFTTKKKKIVEKNITGKLFL